MALAQACLTPLKIMHELQGGHVVLLFRMFAMS